MRCDPWWPAVVLGPTRESQGPKSWRKRTGGREEVRCVFLQADMTHAWLGGDRVRPFLREDAGEARRQEYITRLPK